MDKTLVYIVPARLEGQSVGVLLRRHMGVSAGLLRKLKQLPGGITLDDVTATVRAVARGGQRLCILTETAQAQDIPAVPGPLDSVFEDGHLLILNKPAGLPVHPSRGHYTDTLANRVVAYLGPETPFRAVNRLDRGTSGLVCLAKSRYSAHALGAQLAGRQVRKVYLAVVEGIGLPPEGGVDAPIARVPGRGIMRRVDPDGARAVTRYRVLEVGAARTLVELYPETGRTHQIRVHMAHLGHPVTGDFMYGTELPELDGQALHAARLELCHPVTGAAMAFEAPMPESFYTLMERG